MGDVKGYVGAVEEREGKGWMGDGKGRYGEGQMGDVEEREWKGWMSDGKGRDRWAMWRKENGRDRWVMGRVG